MSPGNLSETEPHQRDADEDFMDDVLSIHASPSGRSIPPEAWAHIPTKEEAMAARALAHGHPELGWSILEREISITFDELEGLLRAQAPTEG